VDISDILSKGTVAVLYRDSGRVIGTAFFVRSDLIVTCAHVVEAAGCKVGEQVMLKFPLTGACITAHTSEHLWRDVQQEDVALLQLDSAFEENSLPLGRSRPTYGHKFISCGFPAPMDSTLKWEEGTIRGLAAYQGYPLIQLDIRSIAAGASGAPVWDEAQDKVVGMITALYEENTAYMTPIESIYAICPELEEYNEKDVDAAIRRLLNSAISAEQLDEICFSRYPSVSERFSASTARDIKVQLLIDYCDRHNISAELLETVKTLNPEKYRQHISDQTIKALGLGAESVKPVDLTWEASRRDYEALRTAINRLPAILQFPLEDFRFYNQRDFCLKIFRTNTRFINLYGPIGVGKTFLLKNLQMRGRNLRTVYIDLKNNPPKESFLPEVIQQLYGGKAVPGKPDLIDLVNEIVNLNQSPENITHFMVLFDSAEERHREVIEWLMSDDGFEINHPVFRELLGKTDLEEKQLKLQVVIASQHPIIKRNLPNNHNLEQFVVSPLAREVDPDHDSLKLMLTEVASRSRFKSLGANAREEICDEIYYLTCGHPKCAMQALLAVANGRFDYQKERWKEIFREYIFKTILEQMLDPLEPGIALILWILSIFRRFDQRILGNLLERQAILMETSDPMNVGLQASQLRPKLLDTHLVDPLVQGAEGFYTMNLFLRRVLSLSMQYDHLSRFKALNHLALEIYTDLLKRGCPSGERALIFFMEIVYHSVKVLEIDNGTNAKTMKEQIANAVQNEYLPWLLRAIDRTCPDDPSDPRSRYLLELRDAWQKDNDLYEVIKRATGSANFYRSLEELILRFISENIN
jgi:hypothetical protein